MEGRSAVWLLAALLLLEVLISAEVQNTPEYFEVGGKLVLKPKPFSGSIRSITWKLNDDIVGVLDEGQELMYAPAFRGRASVDKTTGVLEISNTMKTDSGVYTVTINNNIQTGGYDVRVIKQVPTPVVKVTSDICDQESESCSLSCDGDITEAEPVTFYFRKDSGVWEKNNQSITIINNETTKAVEYFYCRMENPLGQKESKSVENPFFNGLHSEEIAGIVLGVLAAVGVVVGGAVVGGVRYRKQKNGSRNINTSASSTKENGNQGEPLNDRSPDSKNV